jgi:hypothetical protein
MTINELLSSNSIMCIPARWCEVNHPAAVAPGCSLQTPQFGISAAGCRTSAAGGRHLRLQLTLQAAVQSACHCLGHFQLHHPHQSQQGKKRMQATSDTHTNASPTRNTDHSIANQQECYVAYCCSWQACLTGLGQVQKLDLGHAPAAGVMCEG